MATSGVAQGADNVKEKPVDEQPKIVSMKWVNESEKPLAEICYKDKAIIKITTKNLQGKEITIKVVHATKKAKVEDWDKAKSEDVELKAVVGGDDIAKIEFIPQEDWCTKGAKENTVIVQVVYETLKKDFAVSKLKIRPINHNKDMVASDNALRFTASFEALAMICPDGKIRGYQDGGCGKGVWTVGIGEAATGKGITKDTVIESEAEAWTRFSNKMKGGYTATARQNLRTAGVKRKLKQYEFDAMVDMAYNIGNCLVVARLIADGKELEENDFLVSGHDNRRKKTYKLFSGETVGVKGHNKYYRNDNTNGGYCNMKVPETKTVVKDGKKVEEPVMEMKDGVEVQKLKEVKGYKVVESKETYTLTY